MGEMVVTLQPVTRGPRQSSRDLGSRSTAFGDGRRVSRIRTEAPEHDVSDIQLVRLVPRKHLSVSLRRIRGPRSLQSDRFLSTADPRYNAAVNAYR